MPATAQAVYLWLQIGSTYYNVRQVEHPSPQGCAWELKKKKGKRKITWVSYHVHTDQHGAHCDCPAFTYQPDIEGCKHIRACRQVGLIPEML